MPYLGPMLAAMSSLRCLRLPCPDSALLGGRAAPHLAALTQLTRLEAAFDAQYGQLEEPPMARVPAQLKALSALQHLDLSACNLGARESELARCWLSLRQLTCLNLANSGIQYVHVESLVLERTARPLTRLHALNLSSNEVGDNRAVQLAAWIEDLACLQRLECSAMGLSTAGWRRCCTRCAARHS
jgi:hypothetical protein